MLTASSTSSQMFYNGLKDRKYQKEVLNFKSSQDENINLSVPKDVENKSHTTEFYKYCDIRKNLNLDIANELELQQFWNKQKKHKKLSQVCDFYTESILEPRMLDCRLPFEEFNKHKDAEFVRRKKRKVFPSAKCNTKLYETLQLEDKMSVQSVKLNNSSEKIVHAEKKGESVNSLVSLSPNSATRKISFKIHRNATTTCCYGNRKIVTNGLKVAQLTQRFNQLIKPDLTIKNEVKKRGTVFLHQSVDIREEKNNDLFDDVPSRRSTSVRKNSKKKKCSSGKRPNLKVLPGREVKCGIVSSKRQLFETNIINKNKKPVEKPEIPEKSQQVLARTKEIMENILKTETTPLQERLYNKDFRKKDVLDSEDCKRSNFLEVYDNVSVKPSFLYAAKISKLQVTTIDGEEKDSKQPNAFPKMEKDELQLIGINPNTLFSIGHRSEQPIDFCVKNHGLLLQAEATKNFAMPNESFLFRSQFDSGRLYDYTAVFKETRDSSYSNISKRNSDGAISENLQCEVEKCGIADFFESSTVAEENIYQSLCEVQLETGSVKSYESLENCDVVVDNKVTPSNLMDDDDTYIFPDKAPEPPPPRRNTIPRISSPILTSTTSKLIQTELLAPKQSFEHEKTLYEKISYLSIIKQSSEEKKNFSSKHIYDKIQSRYCDDDISTGKNSRGNRLECKKSSMNDYGLSNSYDSFTLKNSSYSTINQIIRHAISSQTLSSEHRINSIYGQSFTPTSDKSASDNSDEWFDLSDEDKNITDEPITLVCNENKIYKSSDWSSLVRRIHGCEGKNMSNTVLMKRRSRKEIGEVFVTSKNETYIYITNEVTTLPKVPISECQVTESHSSVEPIYENIETGNILPSDDNKFKIYVNYDFLSKSNVRLLEPDIIQITELGESLTETDSYQTSVKSEKNDVDYRTISKTMQCQQISMYIDDSDHHYESLYSIQQQRSNINALIGKSNVTNEECTLSLPSRDYREFRDNPVVYDSFDDSDDERSNNDVPNTDLPVPSGSLQATSASYQRTSIKDHMLQKIKNFGSISKNEISKGISKIAKKRSSLPLSRSKFYENTQIEDDTCYSPTYNSKSLNKKTGDLSKLQKLSRLTLNKLPKNFSLNEPFENAIYQHENQVSSPYLSQSMSNFTTPGNQASVGSKSFKTKFRKSFTPLIGSSSTSNIYGALSSKNSTFYVTEALDVDSGIFSVNEKPNSSPNNSSLNLSSNSIANVNCENKRRSISAGISSRPNNPPPPPPLEKSISVLPHTSKASLFPSEQSNGSASWYNECGPFKNVELNAQNYDSGNTKAISSWYTESGLYQTSNNSLASSSGSSGVSTGGEGSPRSNENTHSLFLNEPLYQLYTAAKLESISSSDFDPEVESDGYEEITKKDIEEAVIDKPARPSALQLIEPNQGPFRTFWSEIPEVMNSGIFLQLSQNEKRLQEAKFEILTSEASYLRSLKLLRSHFMNHPAFRDPQILDPADRKTLFSCIVPVLDCSDRFLRDLESCWQENILLKNISTHIYQHAEKHFHVYIAYCEHQGRLDRTLKGLKEMRAAFKDTLDFLENDPVCCGLNLHSFLMLPMQRITRLPLLIDAVMTKLKLDDPEFDDWKMALAIMNKVVSQCNQAANRCEQAFEMEVLSKQIEFPPNIAPFPLIPFNVGSNNRIRTLVKRGELINIVYKGDDAKLTFGKKSATKKKLYCFLFSDLIILTKKKSDESFLVFDYCQRSLLHLSSGDANLQLPNKDSKFVIFMSLLENSIGKPIDLILSCPSETERQRWLATAPRTSENPLETLYEQWDCPQVRVNHSYNGLEPDELDLMFGEFVNVLRKMKDDGWYFGERIRDGAQGWFPGNYAEEVHSSHVRARNLKQRHRLLLYTANYLDAQKEPKKK